MLLWIALVNKNTICKFLFSLPVFLLFINSQTIACEVDKITKAHVSFLNEINFPINTLLIISKNELSIISDKPIINNLKSIGQNDLQLYQYKNGKLILKGISRTNLNPTLINFLNNIASHPELVVINKSGVFVLENKKKKGNGFENCYTNLYHPKLNDGRYKYFPTKPKIQNARSFGVSRISIISHFLNIGLNNSNSEDAITLKLNENVNSADLMKKIKEKRQTNLLASTLILKSQSNGLQISEVQIPISAYDRTRKFKDENELFYSSSFITSKNPKLIKSTTKFNIDLGWNRKNTFLQVGTNFDISQNLSSNVELDYRNSNLNISKLHIGYKQLNNNLLSSSHMGKFSRNNKGLLLNIQKLNDKKDNSFNTSVYFDFNADCTTCLRNGLMFGFERYNETIEGYTRANILVQNQKTKFQKILKLSLNKRLNDHKQFIFSSQYEFNSKSPSLSMKIKIPFYTSNMSGSISATSLEDELISDWTGKFNNSLLDTTTGFLKRNWRNYIQFD